ncbi:MAG: hypothetical protein JHC93_06920 [Parachlamydiales bacterium]|nr:hypothetical protein [Parachlamydiales bacterium]
MSFRVHNEVRSYFQINDLPQLTSDPKALPSLTKYFEKIGSTQAAKLKKQLSEKYKSREFIDLTHIVRDQHIMVGIDAFLIYVALTAFKYSLSIRSYESFIILLLVTYCLSQRINDIMPYKKVGIFNNSIQLTPVQEIEFQQVLKLLPDLTFHQVERLIERVENIGCKLSIRLDNTPAIQLKMHYEVNKKGVAICDMDDMKGVLRDDDINRFESDLYTFGKPLANIINKYIHEIIEEKAALSRGVLKTSEKAVVYNPDTQILPTIHGVGNIQAPKPARKKIAFPSENLNDSSKGEIINKSEIELICFDKFDKTLQSIAGDKTTLEMIEQQIINLENSHRDNHDPLNTKNDVKEWKAADYRIYYIRDGHKIVLLHVSGKQRQDADIKKADRLAGAYKESKLNPR